MRWILAMALAMAQAVPTMAGSLGQSDIIAAQRALAAGGYALAYGGLLVLALSGRLWPGARQSAEEQLQRILKKTARGNQSKKEKVKNWARGNWQ